MNNKIKQILLVLGAFDIFKKFLCIYNCVFKIIVGPNF